MKHLKNARACKIHDSFTFKTLGFTTHLSVVVRKMDETRDTFRLFFQTCDHRYNHKFAKKHVNG